MKTLGHQERTNIGRIVRIQFLSDGRQEYGNVLDLISGGNTPKRVRLQSGPRKGDVVGLGEYKFLWWADEEEE